MLHLDLESTLITSTFMNLEFVGHVLHASSLLEIFTLVISIC